MSSFGAQMRKRLNELHRAGQDVPKIMAEVAEGATIEAVRVATENTPPNDGTIAGTNMRSGDMPSTGLRTVRQRLLFQGEVCGRN